MRISREQMIAGFSAIRIRELLRKMHFEVANLRLIEQELGVDQDDARRVLDELVRLGYAREGDPRFGPDTWSLGPNGARLRLASAAKPLKRATADRKVKELLERVREANASDRFAYRVSRVVLFGSYLGDQDQISDVDVAIELKPRLADREGQRALEQGRIDDAMGLGRSFSNYVEELAWPKHELRLYLKGRSRGLSLHTTDDPVLANPKTTQRVVYEAPA